MALFVGLLLVFVGISLSLTLFLLKDYLHKKKLDRVLPPGPPALPVLGNLLDLGSLPHRSIAEFTKKYGGLMRLWFGDRLVILISDPLIIKEAFITKGAIYSERTLVPTARILSLDGKDLAFSDGELWAKMRKVAHSKLFTMAKIQQGEAQIAEQLSRLTHCIDSLIDQSPKPGEADFRKLLQTFSLNVISTMTFGHRFPFPGEKQEYKGIIDLPQEFCDSLLKTVDEAFALLGSANLSDYLWWLQYVPGPQGAGFQKEVKRVSDKRMSLSLEIVRRHQQTFDSENLRDFVDILIKAAEEEPALTEVIITNIMADLLFGGIDTTANSLAWFLIAMVQYPDIQAKAHEELDRVVGRDRLPRSSDADNLPYFDAVLKEVMRWKPVGPLAIPHRNAKDDILAGYQIPQDSMVMMNIFGAAHNEQLWPDPERFDPDRFLNDKLESVEKKFGFIPFGTGKRICVGMNLAKSELFLAAATLLQRYKFSGEASAKEMFGLTLSPADPLRPKVEIR